MVMDIVIMLHGQGIDLIIKVFKHKPTCPVIYVGLHFEQQYDMWS